MIHEDFMLFKLIINTNLLACQNDRINELNIIYILVTKYLEKCSFGLRNSVVTF